MSSSSSSFAEADKLFKRLDVELYENIAQQFFFEPKDFRTLVEVIDVLGGGKLDSKSNSNKLDDFLKDLQGQNSNNAKYMQLLQQKKIIEDIIEEVVKFQHGGLNNSVDTMSDVIKEYNQGRADVQLLRTSLAETKAVLTAKKTGAKGMKELWLMRRELEETLRILSDLEYLKDAPIKIQRLIPTKRFLNAVLIFNKATSLMFSEDLVMVEGIVNIRDELMESKESLLEHIISEFRVNILGLRELYLEAEEEDGNDAMSEKKSEISDFHSGASGSGIGTSVASSQNGSSELKDRNWTVDADILQELTNIDENVEMSLNFEDSTLPNYDRKNQLLLLLVKAVGELKSEADVERLLVESIYDEFITIVKQTKDDFSVRFRRKASTYTSEEDNYNTMVSEMFSEYIVALLKRTLFTLKRIISVITLLNFQQEKREQIEELGQGQSSVRLITPYSFVFTMKDHIKKLLQQAWTDMEFIIVREVKHHLVEKQIEDISDIKANTNVNTINSNLQNGQDNENDEDHDFDNQPIFPTSVRLAAVIYPIALHFSEVANSILKESFRSDQGFELAQLNRPLTIMEKNRLAEAATGSDIESEVLLEVQHVLKSELIPIVQSDVNSDMREIQSNSSYFLFSSVNNDANKESGVDSKSGGSLTSSSRDGKPIVLSTQIILKSLNPLFQYYKQLFTSNDYKEMITTIVDRHIRGWISSSRESVENLTFRLYCSDTSIFNPVLSLLKSNSIFLAYRKSLHLNLLSASINSKGAINNAAANDLPKFLTELPNWGPMWAMSSSSYPVQSEKISRDFMIFTNIGATINACEWLCMHLQHLTMQTIRQSGVNKGKQFNVFLSGHDQSSSSSRSGKHHSSMKIDSSDNFVSVIQGCMNSLLKLADDCYALIICEIQLSCFFYLHQLTHLKAYDSMNSQGGISHNDFVEAESMVMAWNHHIQMLLEALNVSMPYQSLRNVLITLPVLVPRILLKCIVETLTARSKSSSNLSGNDSKQANNFEKTRLLKVIVACQQCVSLLFDTYIFAQSNKKANMSEIMDYFDSTQADEFERLRKYVAMMDLSVPEFKLFMQNNISLFSPSEYKALWLYSNYRAEEGFRNDIQFEEIWSLLSLTPSGKR